MSTFTKYLMAQLLFQTQRKLQVKSVGDQKCISGTTALMEL